MAVLTYRCPHCHRTLDVSEDLAGETVLCPEESCRRPLKLDVQRATVVDSADEKELGDEVVARALSQADVHSEKELLRRHPAMFRKRPFSFSSLLLLGVASLVGSLWSSRSENTSLVVALAVLAAAVAVAFLVWWIRVLHTLLIVTTKRLTLRTGILSKATTEVRHQDILNLQVNQNVLERMLGVGNLAASSAGQDSIEIVATGIPRPQQIADLIRSYQA